jgi:DNA-binding transcriptional ArsR family regulator
VPAKRRFTRLPKTEYLVPQLREAGVGLHVLPTYHALLDHADNKTGRAWPSVNRLADILGLCRRTVERHLQALQSAVLVLSNGQGRGRRGRFSVCRYVVVAVLFYTRSTVRHPVRTDKRVLYRGTKPLNEPKNEQGRAEEAQRRVEGYKWLFGES